MIVVGAGLVGLACGWTLAKKGRRITIFDRGAAATEASWAAAGMLAPAGEFEADSPLLRMSLRSLALYPGFVDALREESGLPIDLRRCGGLEVALSPDEFEVMSRKAQVRLALGIPSERRSHMGFPGRFYPGDALVDPRQISDALLKACQVRGVEVRLHEEVLEIGEDGRSIRTVLGRYEDSGVLLAAGAWSSGLYPGMPATRPVRGHLVSYHLPPGAISPILRNQHTYVMQRTSGTVLAGSTTEESGFDRTIDEKMISDIRLRAAALVPELASLEPLERWNGLRPGIVTEGPNISRVPGTSVFTAFGHYRNGILLTPETARLVEQLVEPLSE